MLSIVEAIINMTVPFNMIVLVVLIGCLAGVIGTVAKELRAYLCHRSEIALKREMVELGIGSQEIERILSAKVKPSQKTLPVEKQGHQPVAN